MDNLFIGIDFSKKTFDVSVFEGENVKNVHHRAFENNLVGFKEMIKWLKEVSKITGSRLAVLCRAYRSL